jgi:hypothetical protein
MPRLSQMLLVWNGLVDYANNWAVGKGARGTHAKKVFQERT